MKTTMKGCAGPWHRTGKESTGIGGPLGTGAYRGKKDDVFPRWAASIKALAAHQSVYVKVGGLGQIINGLGFNEQAEPPCSEALAAAFRPYLETCIEAFGKSNFPVDKVSYSYPVFWNACKLLAKDASRPEKADLFAGTAAQFYRLDTTGWRLSPLAHSRTAVWPLRVMGGQSDAVTGMSEVTSTGEVPTRRVATLASGQ